MKRIILTIILIVLVAGLSYAKVDLVTLPDRDTVQLTIYNSADMTLARESRSLTIKEGKNELQFSWENTLIDPTSLEMIPKAHAGQIDIANLTFPPRVRNLGLWNINSEYSGSVPIEITYLTSGLSWRAFYMGTLTENEEKMRLQGYVRVTNNSGEDYENSQVRLIVGKVHMLDQIANLARRQYPYDRADRGVPAPMIATPGHAVQISGQRGGRGMMGGFGGGMMMDAAEIIKEGLSEYFLYTIEGTQTIENGWSKRMISFDTEDIPVINLYKYEQERYGNSVIRFLSFTNDEEHELGETPIPGGMLKVYRNVDEEEHLSYAGQSDFKYIPVNEEVELNLGSVSNVVVEPKVMDFKTENYRFASSGSIIGWDEVRTFEIEVRNTRDIPVKVEIKRNFQTQFWQVTGNDDYEDYDLDTIKFTLEMSPVSKQTITYTLRTFRGTREDNAPKRSM
ncbi:MAG: DUF4139 domain-containing protein [Sedimentisphaerales bacterium]|nr:DUF4139 domain-containing protein [Sedimentisphaerales bacterium]